MGSKYWYTGQAAEPKHRRVEEMKYIMLAIQNAAECNKARRNHI